MANKLTPTPKVAAAVLGGIIASAILANITLITPDLFEGLGKWSGLVYGLTITFVMGAAGWLKSEGDKANGDSAESVPAETPAATIPQPPATAATVSAPATQFPAAKVEAAQAFALAAVEPAEVQPVFEAPAIPPAPVA